MLLGPMADLTHYKHTDIILGTVCTSDGQGNDRRNVQFCVSAGSYHSQLNELVYVGHMLV